MTAGRMTTLAQDQDSDPTETQEWLDALEAVIQREGPQRAHYILENLLDRARRGGTLPGTRCRTPGKRRITTKTPH